MGRPTKYSETITTMIARAVSVGATFEFAAKAAGISFETLRVWREKYPAFSAALEKAEGECVVRRLARIEKAGQEGTWQADAWVLERKYPHEYGRQVQEVRGSINVDFSDRTISDIDREIMAVIAGVTKAAIARPAKRAELPVGDEGPE